MPPTRLADSRDVPQNMQEAERLMGEIRRATCERDIIIARTEKRVAALTREAGEKCAPIDREIEEAERRLGAYIQRNPQQFQKPRAHRTQDGEFGLRNAARLEIIDQKSVVECILDYGYDDCIKIRRTLVKPAIIKRIRAGETIPGAALDEGELAFCKVNKVLLQEAVKNALD